jgi:hypothetical protein
MYPAGMACPTPIPSKSGGKFPHSGKICIDSMNFNRLFFMVTDIGNRNSNLETRCAAA